MSTIEVPPRSPDEPSPLFWAAARALTHVGEFRRYYGLLGVWLVVMLVVPRVAPAPFEPVAASRQGSAASATRSQPESAAAAGSQRPTAAGVPTFFSDPVLAAFTPPPAFTAGDDDPAPASGPAYAYTPPPSDPGGSEDDPGPDPAGDEAGIAIPPPPPLPLPAPPAELEPLLRVVSPLANTACSPVGLAGVVVALVAPSVEQVPAGQIVPYLTPLYVACGSFPQTGPRTVCELDQLYVSQDPTGGLLPPPAVIGLGIDTLEQLERAAGGLTMQAEMPRQQLHCRKG